MNLKKLKTTKAFFKFSKEQELITNIEGELESICDKKNKLSTFCFLGFLLHMGAGRLTKA